MTTFVPLTEEDQAFDLVILLIRITKGIKNMAEDGEAKQSADDAGESNADIQAQLAEESLLEAKKSAFGQLVKKKKLPELMTEFFSLADTIMACDESMVDAACSLALSLLNRVATDASVVKEYVSTFSEIFIKEPSDKPELRLKLLTILFNLLDETSELRHEVLVKIFTFTLETEQAALLVTHLSHVETWAEQWKLANTERAALLKFATDLCRQANAVEKKQQFLYKFLKAKNDEVSDLIEEAAELVLAVMTYTNPPQKTCQPCYEYDAVSKLTAVQALGENAKYSGLFKILNIFASGTVPDFIALTKETPEVASDFGLDEELLTGKLRTLTLCSLGAKQERLGYAMLVEHLGLTNSDEVEEVVISAVRTGLLEAKIDQNQSEVVIQRTAARQFVTEDWGAMDKKLQDWKKSVEGVIDTLQQVRSEHEHVGEAQGY